eukprot:5980145-Amphidinium_carterae.1
MPRIPPCTAYLVTNLPLLWHASTVQKWCTLTKLKLAQAAKALLGEDQQLVASWGARLRAMQPTTHGWVDLPAWWSA